VTRCVVHCKRTPLNDKPGTLHPTQGVTRNRLGTVSLWRCESHFDSAPWHATELKCIGPPSLSKPSIPTPRAGIPLLAKRRDPRAHSAKAESELLHSVHGVAPLCSLNKDTPCEKSCAAAEVFRARCHTRGPSMPLHSFQGFLLLSHPVCGTASVQNLFGSGNWRGLSGWSRQQSCDSLSVSY
jgi:hypothetical protein